MHNKDWVSIVETLKTMEPNEDTINLFSRGGKEFIYKSMSQDNRSTTYLAEEDLNHKILKVWCSLFYSSVTSKVMNMKTKEEAVSYWINEVPYNRVSASNILKTQGEEIVNKIFSLCKSNGNTYYKPVDKVKCINIVCDRYKRNGEGLE